MNSIDLFIIIFSSYFLIRGIFKGFVSELATIAGLVAGYLLATAYSGYVADKLIQLFPDIPATVITIGGFALVFIAVNIGVRIIATMITKTLSFAMLGWLNRLLGAVFGLFKGVLILSIVVLILNLLPFSDLYMEKIGKEHSHLYPVLEFFGPKIYALISTTIGNAIK